MADLSHASRLDLNQKKGGNFFDLKVSLTLQETPS